MSDHLDIEPVEIDNEYSDYQRARAGFVEPKAQLLAQMVVALFSGGPRKSVKVLKDYLLRREPVVVW